MDWLIVGLGNPGSEHAKTRHNVGFMIADELARRWDMPRARDRYAGRYAEGRVRPLGEGTAATAVALLCPHTYYNDCGRSVGPARGALRLALDRVLVVHDEIDLPFGDVRTRLGGGLAGNNGLKSIRAALGSPDFMRVRVGIGRPDSTDPEIVSAWVLGRFRESADEVQGLIATACEHVERAISPPAPEIEAA